MGKIWLIIVSYTDILMAGHAKDCMTSNKEVCIGGNEIQKIKKPALFQTHLSMEERLPVIFALVPNHIEVI